MDNMINEFMKNASIFHKGFFLMVTGILFVFMVQVIFYVIVKCWPKKKSNS